MYKSHLQHHQLPFSRTLQSYTSLLLLNSTTKNPAKEELEAFQVLFISGILGRRTWMTQVHQRLPHTDVTAHKSTAPLI